MDKQRWIDEVLKSTENMERAGAGPFFLEKLSSRMEFKRDVEAPSYSNTWLLRASLAVLVFINSIFILKNFQITEDKNASSQKEIYAELSKELGYIINYNY
jgi:hypothetical protein